MTDPRISGVRVRSKRGGTMWDVSVRRAYDLQRLAVVSVGAARLTELAVEVRHWRPPIAGWVGQARLPLESIHVAPDGDGAKVRLTAAEPTDAALLVSAAARLLRPLQEPEGSMLSFAPGLPDTAAALGGRIHDVVVDGEVRDPHVRRSDVLIDASSAAIAVDVDPTVHRPIGRRSTGVTTIAVGTVTPRGLHVAAGRTRISIEGDLGPTEVRALRSVLAIKLDGEVNDRLLHQLHACGVVVVRSDHALPDVDDDLAWQAWSVHERRHALRSYTSSAVLNDWPTVSIVMSTHRASHLAHAMQQLSTLRYPRLEVVIGAHGIDVDEVRRSASTLPHPVTVLALDSALNLGQSLQSCSNRAEGALVAKVDDDDVYGPEHVWDLVLAHQYSGAQVVGKALDWIHVQSENATVFRPVYGAEKYADFVAGGTMLISRADLAAVGGWRPVPKSVDRALLDRVVGYGGLVYRTHGLGYVYIRNVSGHTAAVSDEHFMTKTVSTRTGMVQHVEFGTAS